ncbi:Hypothetical protein NTJ_05344 [Nesidiocoris tenuis]|uniref:Uncharacterized protein n=1 Tax=Nesidiocoris tenuis TaxID=355587 RepID=A0ABN7ANQ4_9HEMI|nr:Hypothetical protein NTJ_05344 [Nesidiocoris tenuis]
MPTRDWESSDDLLSSGGTPTSSSGFSRKTFNACSPLQRRVCKKNIRGKNGQKSSDLALASALSNYPYESLKPEGSRLGILRCTCLRKNSSYPGSSTSLDVWRLFAVLCSTSSSSFFSSLLLQQRLPL